MDLKQHFITGSREYNDIFGTWVPAPYLRRAFSCCAPQEATITVAAVGFYDLFLNGKKITKGFLAPYISNADHFIYYDTYHVTLHAGENVIGLLLGNGFLNNPGGYIWDFEKCPFRSAPMTAVAVQYKDAGKDRLILSDEQFKCAPSPIICDDYRFGEHYDARKEIPGWNAPGFDDSLWENVIPAVPPKGALTPGCHHPIVAEKELQPIAVFPDGTGSFIYDFGESNAGLCRLILDGVEGQKIELQYSDAIYDGKLVLENMWFVREHWERDKELVHKDTYICKGKPGESYTPTFTYHGFRYVRVTGITEAQAIPELLTYIVFHSDIKSRGGFHCSCEVLNQLQEITRRSDLSNFHYFPTDCPQREKNGWTADAALSCEQVLLNFNAEQDYREWMRNIVMAQRENGALPGIIPTYGWGYEWGNGPAWDSVLSWLPYYVYVYRGETHMIQETAHALIKYLHYLTTRTDEDGLIQIGLGDWCQPDVSTPTAPLALTDTLMSMDIAYKTAFMLQAIDRETDAQEANRIYLAFRSAAVAHLIDHDTATAAGNCQTSQAMCLHYRLFTEEETPKAVQKLLDLIHQDGDHMNVGVLGGRVIFHVLTRFGYGDLAYRMITREDYPSYGNWLKRGATTLWENFAPADAGFHDGTNVKRVSSMNHHFWGDISAWFIKDVAGIHFNPTGKDLHDLRICPAFLTALQFAESCYTAPDGKIYVRWEKTGEGVTLILEIPEIIQACAVLPAGYCFADGQHTMQVHSGSYSIRKEHI